MCVTGEISRAAFSISGEFQSLAIWPNSFSVVDIEMTGLDPKNDFITEIAFKVVLNGEPQPTESRLILIPIPLSDQITEITGITDEMLATLGHCLPEVLGWLQQGTTRLRIVGHNFINFDSRFINHALAYRGLLFPWRDDADFIDTAALYKGRALAWPLEATNKFELLKYQRAVLNERRFGLKFNLAVACEDFGIEQVGAHRAAADVEATYQVYLELRELLMEESL